MPKFNCSYAHDLNCYVDCIVEADTEEAALAQMQKALDEGKFHAVPTEICYENGSINPRVFVQGPADQWQASNTLAELTNTAGRDELPLVP